MIEKPSSDPLHLIDALSAKHLIDEGEITVIDVRTKPEIEESGVIGDAAWIDFRDPDFAEKMNALPKNTMYLIYCQSGVRGLKAGQMMEKLDFSNIYVLQGGILTWMRAGLPLLHQEI
ncbi:rhodanese-like domain-containing protein [Methanorbis furvi]|uniref:Sulfurtransferase n=1 Tax=Methanorbis furvi TaxID=3028299 RepID=A0AAE4MDU3_9EURY|nr:Sulfurtransferase [Methanocorpusculaceae archaeon Ag1]